jgi:hypothetical protein
MVVHSVHAIVTRCKERVVAAPLAPEKLVKLEPT